MKTIKLIFILFFIFSIRVFSQNPIIEKTTICITNGSTTNITVTNPSYTESYVWQFKNETDVNWTDITISNASLVYDGYTTSDLSITRKNNIPLTLTKYRVIANDGFGNLFQSNEAVLTVSPLSVAKTISGASAVCIGGDKSLTYAPDSVGDIQWQSSVTSNILNFEDINLENGIDYKATNIQDTTWYRVMNTSGSCNPAYSAAVQVVVNALSDAGSIDGGDISVCKTSNSTDLYLNYSEGKILWQKLSNIGGLYEDIITATSTIYRALNLKSSTYFRAALTNGVCPTQYTEPVYITVNPTPIATSITGISQVCTGSNVLLTYELGSVGDIQWQTSTISSSSDDFNDETGETNLTLSLNNLSETTWVRVVNTSGECNPVYSPVFQVTVDELAYEGSLDITEATVCKSFNSTVLTINDSFGKIQWQRATEVAGAPNTYTNISLATNYRYTASSISETTYFRAIVSNGKCPSVSTESSKITIDQPGIATSISGASPLCTGGSKVLVYEPGSFGDIQWRSSPTSGTADDFSDIPGENSEILEVYNLEETTWFRVTNTNGVCGPVKSLSVKVLVNPIPVAGTVTIVGGNNTVSENTSNTELSLVNHKGSIQWQKSKSLSDDFIDIPNATSSIFQTSGLKDSTYFRTVVSSGDCSKAVSEPIHIKVNFDFDVTLFPNPFDNEFNINLTSLSLDPIEFEVYDLLGRTIDKQKIKPIEINSKKIGTNYLPGFYTLFFKQGKKNKSIKVLKK